MQIKRGDTFTFIVRRVDDLGNPLTGQASNLRSQIRKNDGVLLGEFIIEETVTLGDYKFNIDASITKDFPIGNLYFDIEYTLEGVVTSSNTVTFKVEGDVTH